MTDIVDVVVPRGIDDPAHPSGGNTVDRRLIAALPRAGWTVRTHRVSGLWPRPGACDQRALAFALAPRTGVTSTPVLVDGMLAVGAPAIVTHAAHLRPVVVLSHMLFGTADTALAAAERRVMAVAHAVITVSEAAARALREAYGLPAERVRVVHPGVDAAAASTPVASEGRMLCPAAVTTGKGHDVLVDSLARLPRDIPWSCRCVGALDVDTAFVGALRASIAAADLSGRVQLDGPQDAAGMDAAYAGSDLVVLPSRGETWGLVLTESLARGIPVVASDVGGVREAVGVAGGGAAPGIAPTMSGMLVPAGDAGALADALTAWLTDDALRMRLREAAARRRRSLPDWEWMAAGVAAVLQDARDAWERGRRSPGAAGAVHHEQPVARSATTAAGGRS